MIIVHSFMKQSQPFVSGLAGIFPVFLLFFQSCCCKTFGFGCTLLAFSPEQYLTSYYNKILIVRIVQLEASSMQHLSMINMRLNLIFSSPL